MALPFGQAITANPRRHEQAYIRSSLGPTWIVVDPAGDVTLLLGGARALPDEELIILRDIAEDYVRLSALVGDED